MWIIKLLPSLVFCNYVILGRHILNISRNRIFEAAILSVTEKWTTWSSFLGIWYTFKVCNESLYLKELQCVFIKNNRWFLLRHACFGEFTLILFRVGFFGAAHGWGRGRAKKAPLPKICHTYPIMMKLGTVIPYPKKIHKIYESRDTPLEFWWHQHFFTGNKQILLYREIQI